jgi:hypothetical protein
MVTKKAVFREAFFLSEMLLLEISPQELPLPEVIPAGF